MGTAEDRRAHLEGLLAASREVEQNMRRLAEEHGHRERSISECGHCELLVHADRQIAERVPLEAMLHSITPEEHSYPEPPEYPDETEQNEGDAALERERELLRREMKAAQPHPRDPADQAPGRGDYYQAVLKLEDDELRAFLTMRDARFPADTSAEQLLEMVDAAKQLCRDLRAPNQ